MKKHFYIIILLLFFVLISCSNSKNSKDYFELSKNKDDINSSSYLLLAMLTYNEQTQSYLREDLVRAYTENNNTNSLNIVLLKSTDILEGRITLYKSYAKLGNTQQALDILENTIQSFLPKSDFATLVVNYPFDDSYTLNLLKTWFKNIKAEEKTEYINLFYKFSKSNLNDYTAREAFNFIKMLDKDSYYSNNYHHMCTLSKCSAYLLEKLYDNYNARLYWKQAYNYNPTDSEAGEKTRWIR